jgi:hypothetical protein
MLQLQKNGNFLWLQVLIIANWGMEICRLILGDMLLPTNNGRPIVSCLLIEASYLGQVTKSAASL